MGKASKKQVTNLKKIPHPKGRKVAQLSKNAIRSAGRAKTKLMHQMKVNILGEKILWFKDNLESLEKYTPELTINLIERYLTRFDDELKQIQLKHATGMRKSRQHANREDIVKMTVENEKNEYLTSGIEMPDVLNSKQLKLLKNWSGELRFLQNFTFVRYTKSKLESMKGSVRNIESEGFKKGCESNENIDGKKIQEEKEAEKNATVMDVDS